MLVHFLLGDRTLEQAYAFLNEIKKRSVGSKPWFTSDELPHYAEALADAFSHTVLPPKTGQPGRPQGPQRVVDVDLDYATVHKTRENGRVVKVERKVIYGGEDRIVTRLASSTSQTINTSYVERSNLTFRMLDAHLSRKTLWFAKCKRWLKARFSVIAAVYNFVRPHTSLSMGKKLVTPAMAAAITSFPWTVGLLLGLPML